MKLLTVVGARPQFIKLAPVSKEIRKFATEVIVHTGQHYDENMSDVFFDELGIPKPNYNLSIGSKSHGEQTGLMLAQLEKLIMEEKPTCVLVYGDTNSTLAGALAASKLHVPVIHVEAGLRSFNKKMPEEINRILTDHVSELLFVPTKVGVNNLKNEGIDTNVYEVGDVMYDAVLQNTEKANCRYSLEKYNIEEKEYVLLTLHRAENTDHKERFESIIKGLGDVKQQILWPLHPRTKKYLNQYNIDLAKYKHIKVTEPVGYLEMLLLMKNALRIITDSGGVQKEAYFMQTPCVTLREETEWVETVEVGANVLVGADTRQISEEGTNFSVCFNNKPDLYGDGKASRKIAELISKYFCK